MDQSKTFTVILKAPSSEGAKVLSKIFDSEEDALVCAKAEKEHWHEVSILSAGKLLTRFQGGVSQPV